MATGRSDNLVTVWRAASRSDVFNVRTCSERPNLRDDKLTQLYTRLRAMLDNARQNLSLKWRFR